MRYYLIAGEKSGDMHAGKLLQALQTCDQQVIARGIGGAHMQRAGVELIAHYQQLTLIGFNLLKLFHIFRSFLAVCKKDILAFQPDAVILVDYAGFNLRIAKFAKAHQLKVFYYIPPKVWAWHSQRMHALKAYVDWIYTILPFEKDFYQKHGVHHITYVGHPSVEDIEAYQKNVSAPSLDNVTPHTIRIALLPGSRPQEIKKILPTMLAIVSKLPTYQFLVSAISELPAALYQQAQETPGVTLLYDQPYHILSQASVAVVASGTATLETACLQIPQVVVYKTDPCTYWIAKHLLKVKHISLVNILAGKAIVPELIQHAFTPKQLLSTLEAILQHPDVVAQQRSNYQNIIPTLGNSNASLSTAKHIYNHIQAIVPKENNSTTP